LTRPDPATLQKLLVTAVRDHNVLPLTGRCNLSCCFCSHAQNPPGAQAYDFPPLEEPRLLELASFLDPQKKIIIGESATRLREGEPLTHPRFAAILTRLRERFPATTLQVTTNGSLLAPSTVRLLADLKPLELVLSLNSASEKGRRRLMNDPRPREALHALERIAAAGIPLHGSVVPLPHLVGWDDLERTLRRLDSAGARTIRLLLLGFTRFSRSGLLPPPGTREECLHLAANLKQELRAALLVEPPPIQNFDPLIEGILPGSPAARAGLQAGDRILAIDGQKPLTRVAAFNLAQSRGNPAVVFMRKGVRRESVLPKRAGEAPGFVVSYDLDPAQLERIRRAMAPRGETLMLTSPAAAPRWRWARERFGLGNLRLAAVPSLFFGGTITCAGLLTVTDFLPVLKEQMAAARPAKTLIPAIAFDRGGLDMRGLHYSLLQESGASVTLID